MWCGISLLGGELMEILLGCIFVSCVVAPFTFAFLSRHRAERHEYGSWTRARRVGARVQHDARLECDTHNKKGGAHGRS